MSTRISVRGFNQNLLGFTLDGIPLGDMSDGNNNGLHASGTKRYLRMTQRSREWQSMGDRLCMR